MAVAAGGALGAVMRYLVSNWVTGSVGGVIFPWGTLIINVSGSTVLGFLYTVGLHWPIPASVRLMLTTGILGAYTTFSTFSVECLNLFRSGEYRKALFYIAASVVLGLAGALAGSVAAQFMVNRGVNG